MIGFEVKIDPGEFEDLARKELMGLIVEALEAARAKALPVCRQILRKALTSQKEYLTLFSFVGSFNAIPLQWQFGLSDEMAVTAADGVVDEVVRALEINVINPKESKSKRKKGVLNSLGGLEVVILPENIDFVYRVDDTEYQSNQFTIPWLKWLLERGREILVRDYYVMTGEFKESRSGKAIMVPSGKSKKNFRITHSYAGRRQDNWLTRGATVASPRIGEAVQEAVRREIS